MNLDSVCVYGALVLSKHLNAMSIEMDGVRSGDDIEYIHRMRVASRRLRSALVTFQECFAKKEFRSILKDTRKVTRALGEARDLDIQIDLLLKIENLFTDPKYRPGIRRLLLRLKQDRSKAQVNVIRAINTFEKKQIIQTLLNDTLAPVVAAANDVYLFSPALFNLGFKSIKNQLSELLTHEAYINDPQNKTELHAMRISVKRLRYTLEIFDTLYSGQLKPLVNILKDLQDLLGAIHDADVWIAFLPDFVQQERFRIQTYFGHAGPLRRLIPGLNAFLDDRTTFRDRTYSEFMTYWHKIISHETWIKLEKIIQTPIDLDAALTFNQTPTDSPDLDQPPNKQDQSQESQVNQ